MAVALDSFYAACPGVVLCREMDAALAALPEDATGAAIRAAILPLMPEGNPPQYAKGAPTAPPTIMPGASPLVPAALPPQPNVANPIDGQSYLGTVDTFAKKLPLFADSNPDPLDGWSVDQGGYSERA